MEFDHLAVSGETLAEAQACVEDALGVPMQPGGEHAVFHTHNTLLGLADGLYLEAIAINPSAPVPTRPRWFDLDRFAGPARLTNWICRSEDLQTTRNSVGYDPGEAVDLQRGELRWEMAVPGSGILPFDNRAPALIQWHSPVHPATRLEDRNVRLTRLVIAHPDAEALQSAVSGQLADARIVFETGEPALRAEFATGHGPRVLEG